MDSFVAFGDVGPLYDTKDWESSSVGAPATWSPTLVGVVDAMLHTRFAITLFWGPELTMLYNEAYAPMIGDKHPWALGSPTKEVFPEAWELIGPMIDGVRESQKATWVEDALVPLERHGFLEECYFTFSYSPVRNLDGQVEGVMDIATETTQQVLDRRRLWLLTQLNEALANAQDVEGVRRAALPVLASAREDLPGVDIVLGSRVASSENLTRGGTVALALSGHDSADPAALVVRLSDRLAPDQNYLGFLRLIAAALRQSFDRARARSVERLTADVQRDMAEAFQRSLLPIPRAGSRPDVAVRYRPAAEEAQIGGDWYDLFRLPDGSLMVVIGDVAGHDQKSAAAMAQVRNMTRGVAYTLEDPSPARVLHGIDRAMLGSAQDIVATGVVAQVAGGPDGDLRLAWSNAGHPPPALLLPDGTTTLLERKPDLLLGLDGTTARDEHDVDLPVGATMVLYTDGLIERRGVPIVEGLRWLLDTLAGQQHQSPEELCDYLLEHASDTEDDVALLVLRG